MAVKTRISKKNMAGILSEFGIENLTSIEPVKGGTVQTIYKLTTDSGDIIFKYYNSRTYLSVLFEGYLIRYIREKGFPCPDVMIKGKRRPVGEFMGKPFILFEYVKGEHIINPTWKEKAQLIEKAALLQNLTKKYLPNFKRYRWNYNIDFCRNLAYEKTQKNRRRFQTKMNWYEEELAKLKLPPNIPKGVCHCDFHFSNVLFKNGKFAYLIDFDDANYTYLTYDLASMINPFVKKFNWKTWYKFQKDALPFDFEEAAKIVKEYEKHRPLNANEKRYFFDVYKLSILIDALWYFERGDGYYFYERTKMDFLNSLGREEFHRSIFI